MKIEIYYLSGRRRVWDTSLYCNSDPFIHDDEKNGICDNPNVKNINIISAVDIRLDEIFKPQEGNLGGLWMYVYMFNIECDENKYNIKKQSYTDGYANTEFKGLICKPARMIQIVDRREIHEIAKIVIDGATCIKNIGGQLVNIDAIEQKYNTYVTDTNNIADYEKIVKLFDTIVEKKKVANEKVSLSEVSNEIGIPESIIKLALNNSKIQNSLKRNTETKILEQNDEEDTKVKTDSLSISLTKTENNNNKKDKKDEEENKTTAKEEQNQEKVKENPILEEQAEYPEFL